MTQDMTGKVVSEEEVAKDLGFGNVTELRRWQTDLGHQVKELEYKLSQEKRESESFRWHGRRMGVVLDKVEAFLKTVQDNEFDRDQIPRLLLAIGVVSGRTPDWGSKVKDWLRSWSAEDR